ncbi:MAG: DUF3486 family protein [Spirochaetaceae bacterium]|jgi:hypothetical protein|nr:DUF3486 family protein [Spirochaetaceae bacterium]
MADALSGILLKVSKSPREIERAEKLNAGRTETIRKTTLEDAAEVAAREAKAAGLDEAALDIIKRKILGI